MSLKFFKWVEYLDALVDLILCGSLSSERDLKRESRSSAGSSESSSSSDDDSMIMGIF